MDTPLAVQLSGCIWRGVMTVGKEDEPEPVIAKISQETLADMIGATRSRVSCFMNQFRKPGLISYNSGLRIHSSLLTIVLHDEFPLPSVRLPHGSARCPVRQFFLN